MKKTADSNFKQVIPVLSSSDVQRDVAWYEEHLGFELAFWDGDGYAGIQREGIELHLQWHHNNEEDPVLPGVIKLFVHDIHPIFQELQQKGVITNDRLRRHTPWGTHEFGLFDLNNNAIFFVQDV